MCGEMFLGHTQTRDISNAKFRLRNAEFRILNFLCLPDGERPTWEIGNSRLGTAHRNK